MRYIEVEQEEREFETPVESSTLKSYTFPPKWSFEQKIKIMPWLLFCFVSILIIVYEYKGTRNVQVDTKAIEFNEPGTKAIEFNESDIETFSTSTFLKSFDPPLPAAPGGFKVRGACDLAGIMERNESVDLGVFDKHGIHTTKLLWSERIKKRGCDVVRLHKLSKSKLKKYIDSPNHKLLTTRGPMSFYKSAFNHVCNKDNQWKRNWREINHVDCSKEGEFARLVALEQACEMSTRKNPFLLKEFIMERASVTRIMLVDYTCVPRVVATLCNDSVPAYESLLANAGKAANSAESQNYTDFWSMNNNTPPSSPFDPFWNSVSARLADVCCIDMEKVEGAHQGSHPP